MYTHIPTAIHSYSTHHVKDVPDDSAHELLLLRRVVGHAVRLEACNKSNHKLRVSHVYHTRPPTNCTQNGPSSTPRTTERNTHATRTLLDVLNQRLDVPGGRLGLLLGCERRRHGAAGLVTQHHHEGRLQVQHRVEQGGAREGVHLCCVTCFGVVWCCSGWGRVLWGLRRAGPRKDVLH